MTRVEQETLVDVSCVVHLHTTYSDGTATVPEVVAAARAAGVDLVLVTDHDSLAARRDGWEGRHDGVFALVGTEVSPKQGHYLAFGVDREIRHAGRSALEIAEAVRQAGGVGFAAHPFSRGGHMLLSPRSPPGRHRSTCAAGTRSRRGAACRRLAGWTATSPEFAYAGACARRCHTAARSSSCVRICSASDR
jgi:hypothetical protein